MYSTNHDASILDECSEARRKRNAAQKRYRDTHKDKISAYNKSYREANKEKITALQKRWHDANQGRIMAYRKTKYEANKEEEKAKSRRYYHNNKERGVMMRYKRLRIITKGEFVVRDGEFLEDYQEVECPMKGKRLGIYTHCDHCDHKIARGDMFVHCNYGLS